MKLLSYTYQGRSSWGVVVEDGVVNLSRTMLNIRP
jgi:hypothetical protein